MFNNHKIYGKERRSVKIISCTLPGENRFHALSLIPFMYKRRSCCELRYVLAAGKINRQSRGLLKRLPSSKQLLVLKDFCDA